MTPDAAAAFIREHTALQSPPMLPELKLYLARAMTPIWEASEAWLLQKNCPPPYWAFAWPGGQALARYILDRPETVRGQRVVDLACGAGQTALAAAMAGAAEVVALDIDPVARCAVQLNAAANGVCVETADTLAPLHMAEIIVAGDICYERATTEYLLTHLQAARQRGAEVLLGDPERTYFPHDLCAALTAYAVPVLMDVEDMPVKRTLVWRLL